MADTDSLIPYNPRPVPQLGNDKRYLQDELKRLSSTVSAIRSVMIELEDRIAALGG